MSDDVAHMDSCWCPNCLGQSIDEVRAERDHWQKNSKVSKELFECLMNRIYNVNDFVRQGPLTEHERKTINAYLSPKGEELVD